MWPSGQGLESVDVNLQINLRAMQLAVLAKQNREFLTAKELFDQLIAQVGQEGWGVAVASRGLAIQLAGRYPVLANEYLLLALKSFETARLPDGTFLPSIPYAMEHILWVSAHSCKSDADVDSWLATIAQFTPTQVETLKRSDLMDDNVTILCDGIWLRIYRVPEAERNWGPVKNKLKDVESTARTINFALLEAAAIRTQIMILAEWDQRLGDAVSLSEAALRRFGTDDARFLVLEVTGRQLSYANKKKEAIEWLERALGCDAFNYSLWRRNVLITMAELQVADNPGKAPEFTAAAVRICKEGKLIEPACIEALAEHGMALWRAGKTQDAFVAFEESVNRLFAIQSGADSWKGIFVRVFGVIAYFSALSINGKPPTGQSEPEQGIFLGTNEQAYIGFRSELLAFVCIRLGMFADSVGDVSTAAAWTWKAIAYAEKFPSAWDGVRASAGMQCQLRCFQTTLWGRPG